MLFAHIAAENAAVCLPKWAVPTPFPSRGSMRKKKLKKAKKVTADVYDSIFQEFGIVIPIGSNKYPSVD